MHDSPLFSPIRRRGALAVVATRGRHERQSQPHPSTDDPLIAILDAPLGDGETTAIGFARKEKELGAAFARLSILAAYALRRRLANPMPGDVLAEKFSSRFTVERRNRLHAFLADARRRAALAEGK